jgi:hypothetical protein
VWPKLTIVVQALPFHFLFVFPFVVDSEKEQEQHGAENGAAKKPEDPVRASGDHWR